MLPIARVLFFLEYLQYRMNLYPNTATEYLKHLFVHLHD